MDSYNNDETKLQTLQISKFIDSVYRQDLQSIDRLCKHGFPDLINLNDDTDGKTALIVAVQIGSAHMVEELFKHGADPNKSDFRQRIPLMFACQIGDANLCELLCKNNSNVNAYDLDAKSCLSYCFIAQTSRHMECVNILLKHGADCNLQIEYRTPFLEACEHSKYIEQFCLVLLSNGKGDSFSFDKNNGNRPLHYAALNGSVNLCYSLIKTNSDPNQTNISGQTASHLAAQNGNLDILRLLWCFGADFNQTDKLGNTAMHYAYKNFDLGTKKLTSNLIKYLSSRGTIPIDKNSKSNLLKEIKKYKKAKIGLFRQARLVYKKHSLFNTIDIEKVSSFTKFDLNSFIYWMMQLNDLFQSTHQLLSNIYFVMFGDSVKINRDEFKSFIKKCFIENIPELVLDKLFDLLGQNDLVLKKKLFNLGAYAALSSINFRIEKGIKIKKKLVKKVPTPVSDKKENLKKISTSRIFIPIKTIDSKGPNFQYKYFECIDPTRFDLEKVELQHVWQNDSKWYITSPNKTKVELANFINSGDLKSLNNILKNKKPIEQSNLLDLKDKYHKTPLMTAVIKGKLDMVEFLLSKNVDVNLADNFKWTALHHAVNIGNLEIVKLLIENKANYNLKTLSGKTPLSLGLLLNMTEIVIFLKNLK